jgi:GNAT superfamily N-acetyltransferase
MAMALTYLYSSVPDLSEEHYKLCSKHNLGSRGQMSHLIYILKRGTAPFAGKVLMLWDDDEFVGWALLLFGRPTYYPAPNLVEIQFWVLSKHRRKGYGTELYRLALERTRGKSLKVTAWNPTSRGFFRTVTQRCKRLKITDWTAV